MREELAELARNAIAEKVVPGCVLGVVREGARYIFPFGRLTYDAGSPEVGEDTIYDLASVTKSIPVASLAAIFVAKGKLRLDEKISVYLPELQNDYGATIEDLLRYRVFGSRMSTLGCRTFEQLRTHIFEHGFDGPPGESGYSNLPAFLLGMILERAGEDALPALAHKYFFGPLEMADTTFFPQDTERVAPTELVNGVEIRGIVHDEGARLFAQRRRAVGHAGLFSTAPDLLKFLAAMLQGAFPPVLEAAKQGLGWQVKGDFLRRPEQGFPLLKGSGFGKTGFTGTFVAADPERALGFVLLSNRTYPRRPPDIRAIKAFRERAAKVVFSP